MIYLLMYDITNNSLRSRIARRMIAEGFERIQLSVFLGINNPKDNTTLWHDLNQWMITEPTAKLFILPMTKNNLKNMLSLGDSKLDIDYIIGDLHTLFI